MKRLAFLSYHLVFVGVVLGAQADYYRGNLENSWYWLPATGTPAGYLVEKTNDSGVTWEIILDVEPTLVDYRGAQVVMSTYLSTKEESYQIRVCAYDLAGNKSPYSVISDVLHIKLSPGKPEIVIED